MIGNFTSGESVVISYKFILDDKTEKLFHIKLDQDTLNLIREEQDDPPNWTMMENFACPNCPLNSAEVKHCPLAISLCDVISFFSDTPSYEDAKIIVETPERKYFKKTSVQIGVSGLIGILMVTSGCPIMAKLKPMVRFHLPFASLEETQFRVFSTYLLAQLIKQRTGKNPDWEMDGLNEIYREIEILNQNVASKIADLEKRDASINAVVVLNNFANFVTITLEEKDLDFFEKLFAELM